MTDFRTSMTTLEIDAPQLRATQLIARPGTLPTVTIPMAGSSFPDVDGIWRHLGEAAQFFGVPMPTVDDLGAAIAAFAERARRGAGPALIAATVTIAETDGASQVLVTGAAVTPLTGEPVRIECGRPMPPPLLATDPWWRRMAARTTSRAEADRCERWLNADGYADGLCDGRPVLGALVLEVDGAVIGVENSEPTSILDQMAGCGAIAEIDRVDDGPTDADRVWWLSPRYRIHPVSEIHGRRLPIDPDAVPSFARWS